MIKCAVLIETGAIAGKIRGKRCITTLLESDLRPVNMRVAEFSREDDTELLSIARGTLLDYLYYYLRNRPEDLRAS